MPAVLTQTPVVVTITLQIEPRSARPGDLVRYLERAITDAMQKAQYATPAGSRLISLKTSVVEPTPCPSCGEDAHISGDILSCPTCHTTGMIVAQS